MHVFFFVRESVKVLVLTKPDAAFSEVVIYELPRLQVTYTLRLGPVVWLADAPASQVCKLCASTRYAQRTCLFILAIMYFSLQVIYLYLSFSALR